MQIEGTPTHTYTMEVYLRKVRARVTADVTATHATCTLNREGRRTWMLIIYGQLIFVAWLIQRSEKKEFNCCGTVKPQRKGCHRALVAACFFLVSHLTYYSTLTIEVVRSSGKSVDTY
jgi:hypothetical protein